MELSIPICIIVLIILLAHIYKSYFMKSKAGTTILWFYRDGCGWCHKMQADWDKFSQMVADNPDISIHKINTEKNQKMAEDYGVSGVPHIVKVCKGKRIVYSGSRSADDLKLFAETAK